RGRQVVGEGLAAPVDGHRLGAGGCVVGHQRLGAVRVEPGDVLHVAGLVRVDPVRARLHELGQLAHVVVLDGVVDLAAAVVVHGDQPGAGAATAVVRSHALVDREAPLHHRLTPVAGVVDDVVHVLVLLVGNPGAAGVLGVELTDARVLV